MESQLQSLIDKIKADGVAEADRQAKALLAQAEEQASRIIAEARQQAEHLVSRAKEDVARTEDAGKKALEQAGRNLVLGVEKNLTDLFDRILKDEIKHVLTPDALVAVLDRVVSKWDPEGGVVVELSPQDAQALARGLVAKLQEKARGGLTVKPVETVDAGFSVGEKNGHVYYDFSHKGIAEVLSQYVNPVLGEILKKGIR